MQFAGCSEDEEAGKTIQKPCASCTEDEYCDDNGMCQPREEGDCGSKTCNSDETCEEGVCVPNVEKDPCEGKTCSDGQKCDKGECVPDEAPKECTGCGENETCQDGKCVCGSKECGANQVCNASGVCENVQDDLCQEVVCQKVNETCNPDTGICDCNGVVCGEGKYCSESKTCSEGDPCEGMECSDGLSCVFGKCICKGNGDVCAEGYSCENDACVDKRCETVSCKSYETCEAGECVDRACDDVKCDVPGQECKGGACIFPKCVDVECPEGSSCNSSGDCERDDAPKIKVLLPDGAVTSEDGSKQVTIAVYLEPKPAGEVTVNAAVDDATEGAVSGGSTLVFNSDNYSTPQNITVMGVADSEVDGDQTYKVTLSSSSSEEDFNKLEYELELTNLDTDGQKAGLNFVLPDSLITSEDKTSVTIGVSLKVKPTSDVTVSVKSSNTGEGTVDKDKLTFTTANWDAIQNIVVTGVDDDNKDGTVSYRIEFEVASSDATYDKIKVDAIDMLNADNDKIGMTVSPMALTVKEGDAEKLIVLLSGRPTKDVVISAAVSDKTAVDISPESVTFTTDNYAKPQEFLISGISDDILGGDKLTTVAVSAAAAGTEFDGLKENVTVLVKEGNVADLIIESCPTRIDEGKTGECQVSLAAKPTAETTVTMKSLDDTELTLSDESFKFTPENWNVAQKLTVTAVKDHIIDADQKADITFVTTSKDKFFDGLEKTKTVEVADINSASIRVECPDLKLDESDTASHVCQFYLNAKPSSAVTLSFSSANTAEVKFVGISPSIKGLYTGTLGDKKVTIAPKAWTSADSYIKFSYSAVNDSKADGDTQTLLNFSTSSKDTNFNGKKTSATITVLDDDTAKIHFNTEPGSDGVSCGTEFVGKMSLSSVPTGNVTVTMSLDTDDGLMLSPASITFTPKAYKDIEYKIIPRKNNTTVPKKAYYPEVKLTAKVTTPAGTFTSDITKTISFPYMAFCSVNATEKGTVTLPPGKYSLKAIGGAGGNSATKNAPRGGYGAMLTGKLEVKENLIVGYRIGGKGKACFSSASNLTSCGGTNGGGSGSLITKSGKETNAGYGGGGATELWIGEVYDQGKRIMVAAGGGGAGNVASGSTGGDAGVISDASHGAYGSEHNAFYAEAGAATNENKAVAGDSTSADASVGAGGGGGGWNGGKAGRASRMSGAAGASFIFTGTSMEGYAEKGGTLKNNAYAITNGVISNTKSAAVMSIVADKE